MDSQLLVMPPNRERIDAGAELLRRLIALPLDVSGAAWVRLTDDVDWHLNIVSQDAETRSRQAYMDLHVTTRQLNVPWLDPVDIRLLRPGERLAKGITDLVARYPGVVATWYGGFSINGLPLGWPAYIYPNLKTVPQPA